MHKIALVQRICPHYRVPIFKELAKKVDLTVLYGNGQKVGSYQNARLINDFKSKKLLTVNFDFSLGSKSYYVNWFPFLIAHLLKDRPKAIITEGVTNILNNISLSFFSFLTGTPLIWWGAGKNIGYRENFIRPIIEPILFLLMKQPSAYIAYSKGTKKYFISKGISEKKIFIAENTIDFDFNKENEKKCTEAMLAQKTRLSLVGKKVILYSGALEKERRINNLLDAYRQIKAKHSDIALIIIGDGSEKRTIEEMVNSLRLEDIHLLGRVTEDIATYFFLCDMLVLPGWSSLAINQAMFYGKPVVTVQYGGPEYEIVENGKNGFLIERDNIQQLVFAVSEILWDDELREKMGKKAKETIKDVTVANMVKNIVNAIKYCLNE